MNYVSIVHSEKEVRLVGDVHLAAGGLDQAEGGLVRVGVAHDGLALVRGQEALDGHCGGASLVHLRWSDGDFPELKPSSSLTKLEIRFSAYLFLRVGRETEMLLCDWVLVDVRSSLSVFSLSWFLLVVDQRIAIKGESFLS